MDKSIIEQPNTNKGANLNLHHHYHQRPSTINSHSPKTSLLQNGAGSSRISDVEMIMVQSVSYTSLKDLLPSTSSSSAVAITTSSQTHNSSWHDDISIKDPLVKQAALAYLQPMLSPPEVSGKDISERLKDCCCGGCGCVSLVIDVVWRNVKETFMGRTEEVDNDDLYFYNDDDDEEHEVD